MTIEEFNSLSWTEKWNETSESKREEIAQDWLDGESSSLLSALSHHTSTGPRPLKEVEDSWQDYLRDFINDCTTPDELDIELDETDETEES